jgi:hypothetical protein
MLRRKINASKTRTIKETNSEKYQGTFSEVFSCVLYAFVANVRRNHTKSLERKN